MKRYFIFFVLVTQVSLGQNCVGTAGQLTWQYWNFSSYPDTAALFAHANYPNWPDGKQSMASLKAPTNYLNNFAGMMRGFIKVDTTAAYEFNLSSDDRGYFYLSTDSRPETKSLKAYVQDYTSELQTNKYPAQTSSSITLKAGQYYYFEVLYFEGGGGDHATVQWRKTGTNTFKIIDFTFLFDYGCTTTCLPAGTPCNDANPATTNDIEDGNCNCVGEYPKPSACIGKRSSLDAYYYDGISGGYVENDLINAPKFPLVPDRREKLKSLAGPNNANLVDNYGSLVQGYLTVPVSGNYQFNLTGDNQTFFFLSKNDSLQYKQNTQLLCLWGTAEYEHNSSVFQSSAPIYMQKGKYYYFELRHKESTWRDYFNIFWKTPSDPSNHWKRIPLSFVYDYNCEIACIAQGTLCDDGNAFTNNDQINANCDCVGVPCSGPDCNDLGARYALYEDCKPTDILLPINEETWESCSQSANPNPARGNGHWIKYSFPDAYQFKESRVWNFNVTGQTNKGFRQVVVDYSADGTTWQQLSGTYNWPIASGTSDYAGFIGPNFNHVKAKHILVTALNNHGHATCSAFGKVAFEAQLCNDKGTACDDADPTTSFDQFDNNCNCRGVKIDCQVDSISLGAATLADAVVQARMQIESISKNTDTGSLSFTAGNSIVLLPGFEVPTGKTFKANIEGCIQQIVNNIQKSESPKAAASEVLSTDSFVDSNTKKIIFKLSKPGKVKLSIQDANAKEIVVLYDQYSENIGAITKLVPLRLLPKGTNVVVLELEDQTLQQEISVN